MQHEKVMHHRRLSTDLQLIYKLLRSKSYDGFNTPDQGIALSGGIMSKQPQYIALEEARHVLQQLGVALTPQQMKRAADRDAHGRRKLPFFVDPIEGTLKIEKDTLINIYVKRQLEAERNLRHQ